jgi:ATP-dependent Lon protease
LLEIDKIDTLATEVFKMMHNEMQMLELKSQIDSKVRVDIEKQQRDYFLNQQLKTIQEELGQNPQESEYDYWSKEGKRKSGAKRYRKLLIAKLRKSEGSIRKLLNIVCNSIISSCYWTFHGNLLRKTILI